MSDIVWSDPMIGSLIVVVYWKEDGLTFNDWLMPRQLAEDAYEYPELWPGLFKITMLQLGP